MTTITLEKSYKKLQNRLAVLERVVKEFLSDELKSEKVKSFEKISKRLDSGAGKRFSSYRAFRGYLKSL